MTHLKFLVMTMTEKAREKNLEKRWQQDIKKLGGEALKFSSPYYTGWPDRFTLMPGAKLYLVEFKTQGMRPTPQQYARIRRAEQLGFPCFVIDSDETYHAALNEVKRRL